MTACCYFNCLTLFCWKIECDALFSFSQSCASVCGLCWAILSSARVSQAPPPPTPTRQPAGRTMWRQPRRGLMGDAVHRCTTQQKMKLLFRLQLPHWHHQGSRICSSQHFLRILIHRILIIATPHLNFDLESVSEFKMEYHKYMCSHICVCVCYI